MTSTQQELSKIYRRRFSSTAAYRNQVWRVLIGSFFSKWIPQNAAVLDLGCGYGEFINNISAGKKFAMDLNPDAPKNLGAGIQFIHQDCSVAWPLPENSLDVVFTSNFFEHLPSKALLSSTLQHAFRALKPGGCLIALGPNIKYLGGQYWDFYDHHVYLTELALAEALEIEGYELSYIKARFLPFTMVGSLRWPMAFVRLYLALPWLWPIKGRQFLVVARKPGAAV